jgi:2-polyprenyl-3-methyl-5-hydroxy-6-metoxy-1,4-benzoquinol methylase
MPQAESRLDLTDQHVMDSILEVSPLCPLCGGGDLVIILPRMRDRLGHVPGEFDFYKCRHCGSVSIFPLPAEEEISGFYPPSYMVTRPSSKGDLGGLLKSLEWRTLFVPVYQSGAKSVLRCLGLKAGKILEIGCSSGYQLSEFKKLGDFEVVGVDIDGVATEHARRELGLNVLNSTLREADLPPDSFDLVILFNVIEHLVNPLGMLEEISRVLKPGGTLAIKTQMIDSLQGRALGRRWMVLGEVPRHVLLASTEGMRLLLKRAQMTTVCTVGGSALENSVTIALSLIPQATALIALQRYPRAAGFFIRLAGLLVGVACLGAALAEKMLGVNGTMIFVAKKDSEKPAAGLRLQSSETISR